LNILYISSGITFGRDKYKLGLVFSYRVIRALHMKGHKITLVCLSGPDKKDTESSNHLKPFCSNIILAERKSCKGRLAHRALRLYCFITNTYMEAYLAKSQDMKNKIISMDNPDLFDIAIYDAYDLVQYSGCIRNIPKILYLGDSITLRAQEMMKSKYLNLISRMEIRRCMDRIKGIEKNCYTDFAKCIVAAEGDKKAILGLNSKLNIEALPFSVDTVYFKKTKPEEENIILFTGILWTEHNCDAVLYFCNEILPLIRRKNRDAVFILVGGAAREEIKKCAKKDTRIKLVDFVEDIRPYLEKATVFVSPIRLGAGMNNKVLEAMSMEKAIVTTEHGNRSISLKDGLEAFVCDDKFRFAEKVSELLKDKEKRRLLGQNARIKAEKEFSIEAYAGNLDKIIETVRSHI